MRQSEEAKRGEIAFRKELYEQQVDGIFKYENEFDREGIETILRERMEKTYRQLKKLKEDGVILSPFLEIGAERCQRSLVLENDLSAEGIAVDISYFSLKSCAYYQSKFHKSRAPRRLCCDVNYLPIRSNSIPFIFCYETLHHFPDPVPIIRTIYHVLSPGGVFYFDEEPFRKTFHVPLYTTDTIYSEKELNKNTFFKAIDYFFGTTTCNETEHGIIENDEISLKDWKEALDIFDTKTVTLDSFGLATSDLYNTHHRLNYFINYLVGGTISGICRKDGSSPPVHAHPDEFLICPDCLKDGDEVDVIREGNHFHCPNCSRTYPIVDDIYFLFPYQEFEQLYPHIFDTLR